MNSAFAVIGDTISKLEFVLPRLTAEDLSEVAVPKTREVVIIKNKRFDLADAQAGEVEFQERIARMIAGDDCAYKQYILDSNELNLLEMAERRLMRTSDREGVACVWRWIARRSGVIFETITMIPGTQQFEAIPVETKTRRKAS